MVVKYSLSLATLIYGSLVISGWLAYLWWPTHYEAG
jgi:hypothetical protein